jgi:hypothetical protein
MNLNFILKCHRVRMFLLVIDLGLHLLDLKCLIMIFFNRLLDFIRFHLDFILFK